MASPTEGMSVRSMKLKVLYTFDAEHRNNHLARSTHALDIQTVFIDEVTQLGIIELKTCLEVVNEASPELLTNPDNDFTIYAYDYSEEDTPLVGQGLLSRQMSPEGEIKDKSNENMITGRITKNIMGLFGKGTSETLEVKLRFNPVAHSNDLRSASSRRGSMSVQDHSQQAWSISGNGIQRSTTPVTATGLESLQRMLSEGGPARDRTGSFAGGDMYNGRPSSRPPSRPSTPTLPQAFNPPMRQSTSSGSRPASRAGMQQGGHARRDSFNSGYYSGEDVAEEGPARKRAKVTKINQPTRSDLNIERQPDSLRVVASSASSLRLHRPVPVNPAVALQIGTSAEEPVRPPTPIPTKTGRPRGRPRKHNSSNLHQSARARPSSPAAETARQSLPPQLAEISMSSPEDSRARSASSTPANFPSSPPVMHDHTLDLVPPPSSPRLPDLPGNQDSGFMSSNIEDIFGDGMHFLNDNLLNDQFLNDHADGTLELPVPEIVEPADPTNTYESVFEEGNDIDENISALSLPQTVPIPPNVLVPTHAELAPPPRPLSRTHSIAPFLRAGISSPKLAPAPIPRAKQIEDERRASEMAQMPSSDPIGRGLHRSNTWAGDMSDLLTSDAITVDESRARNGRKRVGKDQTRARLEAAIASGELPPYCDNCGAIETPAWRRAFRRDFDCPWDEVETSLEDGSCNIKEPTEWNEDGSIKAFKGYKTTRKPEDRDDQWVAISLCNPCGLWFHKQKCMRPPEKWQKRDPTEKRKRKARSRPSRAAAKKTDGGLGAKSDAATPASDGSSPDDTATDAPEAEDRDINEEMAIDITEPELPPMPRMARASTAEPSVRGLRFAMAPKKRSALGTRAVQSSPIHGSAKESVQADLTPKPLRRQLFPSPNKHTSHSEPVAGTKVQSDGLLPSFVRRSPRLNKTIDFMAPQAPVQSDSNKENEGHSIDDGLDDLFDHMGGDEAFLLPPITPTPKRRSDRILFKTPSKTPQRNFGGALSPNLQRHAPGLGVIPSSATIIGTAKSLKDMTPFTRSIHDALAEVSNSPTGNAQYGGLESDPAFDFPDLPSLKGSSPMANRPMLEFDFSELTTEHLNTDFNDAFSTDAPVPSSPPPAFFNFINSHNDDGIWGGLDMGNGGYGQVDQALLSLHPGSSPVLRRSPRKRR